jgi:hypothetical protein
MRILLVHVSVGVDGDDRLDDVVELGREDVVALGDVLKRNPVADNLAGLQVTVLDV